MTRWKSLTCPLLCSPQPAFFPPGSAAHTLPGRKEKGKFDSVMGRFHHFLPPLGPKVKFRDKAVFPIKCGRTGTQETNTYIGEAPRRVGGRRVWNHLNRGRVPGPGLSLRVEWLRPNFSRWPFLSEWESTEGSYHISRKID